MEEKEKVILEKLALSGEQKNLEQYEKYHEYFEKTSGNHFPLACAISLCVANYGQDDPRFIKYAAEFIGGKIERDPLKVYRFCFARGAEMLDTALLSYRTFYKRAKHLTPDFDTCSAMDIRNLQIGLFNHLKEMVVDDQIKGIKSFLFLYPFKLILCEQKRLWKSDGADKIVLPIGMGVRRGVNNLVDNGYSFMEGADINFPNKFGEPIIREFRKYEQIHSFISNLAEIAGTTSLHMNSGLHDYGATLSVPDNDTNESKAIKE